MKLIIIKAIFLILLTFYPINVYSQENRYIFETISRDKGLSQATIICSLQDSQGFLWFGTEDGLNRYDGHTFKIYKNIKNNKSSLSNSTIKSIYEDHDKNLWIGTNNGLNRYNRTNDSFTRFLSDSLNLNSISNNEITDIIGSKDSLWVSTANGLNKINLSNELITRYYIPTSSIKKLIIKLYSEEEEGSILVGTVEGLYRFYIESNSFEYIPISPKVSKEQINDILIDSINTLWITTENGIYFLKENEKQFKKLLLNKYQKINNGDNDVILVYEDSEGVFWFGTTTRGLFRYNANSNEIENITSNLNDANSLNNNAIISVLEDSSGIMWFGTYSGGINKFNRKFLEVSRYSVSYIKDMGLSHNSVYSVIKDSYGDLWVGTSSGLNRKKSKSNSFMHYYHDDKKEDSIINNKIYSIYEDKYGTIWLGTKKGLSRYNRISNNFTNYYNKSSDDNLLSNNKIFSIVGDKNNLWLGTLDGITKFSIENSKTVIYRNDVDKKNYLSSNIVYKLYKGTKNRLWIGTHKGLDCIDSVTGKIIDITDELGEYPVFGIYEHNDNIWVGSWGNGLIKYNFSTNTLFNYMEYNNSELSVIYGILSDNNGNLWLSSNNGILKLDPITGVLTNLNHSNGIKNYEFNLGAYYKAGDGEQYWGGVGGLESFYPESLKLSNYSPQTVFTDFKINNESIHINQNEKLELNYKQNTLSFEFASLDFANPKKNKYKYRLVSYDKDWTYSKSIRNVTYRNLRPGKYIFEVEGSNSDGLWSGKIRNIRIHISPPFWFSRIANFLYFILIILICIFLYRIFKEKQKSIYAKKMQELELKNVKKLNKQRNNLFVNIAHELKTPLTLIENYLEEYMQHVDSSNELLIMEKYIKKISYNIVNFLDLKKMEEGIIFYNHENVIDFSRLLREKVILFRKTLIKEEIHIQDEIQNDILIECDPAAIDSIMNNLIGNAVKYSRKNSNIKISLYKLNKTVYFIIEDNGVGISEEQQEKIFSPYYQISKEKRNVQGIGMGLNIVKNIMTSINGSISVKSKLGLGSSFKLEFKESSKSDVDDINFTLSKPVDYSSLFPKTITQDNNQKEKYNILIVEDNLDLLNYLRSKFKMCFNVYSERNGINALKLLENIPKPDLIISDIMMDEMNGYDFCKKLTESKMYNSIPIIFITAKTIQEEAIKGLTLGAVDYIHKPFSVSELISKVNSIISFSKKIKGLDAQRNNFEKKLKKHLITKREKDIIKILTTGKTNKEISSILNLSEGTVRKHLDNIYNKCGIHNRTKLVETFMVK